VKAQLRIAAGERLENDLPPKLEIRGHAIECRINAEHPQKFTPSAGKITAFNVPGGNGVRVDTAQYAEGVVPPYYDSLIAKLIVHGVDRAEAIAKMERALGQFVVQGIETSFRCIRRFLRMPGSGRGIRYEVYGAVFGDLRYALSVVVHIAKIILSIRQSVISGFAFPECSFYPIFLDSPAFVVHSSDATLSIAVILQRRLLVPTKSLSEVPRYTLAGVKHITEPVFRRRLTAICAQTVPADCLCIILPDATTLKVQSPERVCGIHISVLGAGASDSCDLSQSTRFRTWFIRMPGNGRPKNDRH
jgi:hypothetical protein